MILGAQVLVSHHYGVSMGAEKSGTNDPVPEGSDEKKVVDSNELGKFTLKCCLPFT